MRAQFHGCDEAQLVVVDFNIAHDQTAASAARSYYSNALLCRSRERSDRTIRTVPVANARQHDAFDALFRKEINYFGAEIFVGVDNLYARQVGNSLLVVWRVVFCEKNSILPHHAGATTIWRLEGIKFSSVSFLSFASVVDFIIHDD